MFCIPWRPFFLIQLQNQHIAVRSSQFLADSAEVLKGSGVYLNMMDVVIGICLEQFDLGRRWARMILFDSGFLVSLQYMY